MLRNSPDDPSHKPFGYVMAVISMRQLLADGLPEPGRDYLTVRILDLSTGDQHEVLFELPNAPACSVTWPRPGCYALPITTTKSTSSPARPS